MALGRDKKSLEVLGPIEKVMRMPQLMFVPHDANLYSTMKRFRAETQRGKKERKAKDFQRLNPQIKWE